MMNINLKEITNSLSKVMALAVLSLSLGSVSAQAQEALSLDALLNQLQQGNIAQTKQNREREQEFKAKVYEQQTILNNINQQRDQALLLSSQLEQQFADNEIELGNKTDALDKR